MLKQSKEGIVRADVAVDVAVEDADEEADDDCDVVTVDERLDVAD